jgi:hypothetical protein
MKRSVLLVVALGCANAGGNSANPAEDSQQVVTPPQVTLECRTQPGSQAVGERKSPFDSVRITAADKVAQLCYGRPSVRGRLIFGAAGAEPAPLVPYGKLWRTGANEPTIIHIPFPGTIAGIRVEPGSYSLYTVPGESSWTVIVNRSVTQWGHESRYTPEVEAQEVGRATVPSERMDELVEMFTIRSESTAAGADLILEWERTRVRIPIAPAA